MRRTPVLPIRLVAGQNGDPRFVPPVAFGADYARQVSTLQSKLDQLQQIIENDKFVIRGHITTIKAKNELLEQLKGLDIKKLQGTVASLNDKIRELKAKIEKSQVEAVREKAKFDQLQRELKACKAQSKSTKAQDKKAFEAQINALSAKITSLRAQADQRTKLAKEREAELKRLYKFINDLYSNADLGAKKRRLGTDEEQQLDAQIDEFLAQNEGLVDFTELDRQEEEAKQDSDDDGDDDDDDDGFGADADMPTAPTAGQKRSLGDDDERDGKWQQLNEPDEFEDIAKLTPLKVSSIHKFSALKI